jgi:hypothetical protein
MSIYNPDVPDNLKGYSNGKCRICGSELTTGGICNSCKLKDSIKDFPKQEYHIYGWTCPKCGSVIAPFQAYCVKCTRFDYKITC